MFPDEIETLLSLIRYQIEDVKKGKEKETKYGNL